MILPRIEIHDGVFDSHLHRDLHRYIHSLTYKDGWHSNHNIEYTQYHAEIGHGGRGNREDISQKIEDEFVIKAWDVIQAKVIREPRKLLRCYANKNTKDTEGFPHRDTDKDNHDDLTCICYFCGPEWKLEWCGETALVRGDEIIKSVIPRENRVFLFPSNMVHIARSVTRLCERPRIVLVFKSSPNLETGLPDNSAGAVL